MRSPALCLPWCDSESPCMQARTNATTAQPSFSHEGFRCGRCTSYSLTVAGAFWSTSIAAVAALMLPRMLCRNEGAQHCCSVHITVVTPSAQLAQKLLESRHLLSISETQRYMYEKQSVRAIATGKVLLHSQDMLRPVHIVYSSVKATDKRNASRDDGQIGCTCGQAKHVHQAADDLR